MSELIKKRVPRAEPKLWHELSVAAWDRFDVDSRESRKRCQKVREANAKTYLQSEPSNGKTKRKSRSKTDTAEV